QAAHFHAEFFRDLVVSASPASRSDTKLRGLTLCIREIDNIRTALDWAFSPTGDPALGITLTAAYAPVWIHFGLIVECRNRVGGALDHLDPQSGLSALHQMRLLFTFGDVLFLTMGPVERAKMAMTKALEIAENLDDIDTQLQILRALWAIHQETVECHLGRSPAERFCHVARAATDPSYAPVAKRVMGYTLHCAGNQHEAQLHFERMLELYGAPKVQRQADTFQFDYDQRVLGRSMLARVLCVRGLLDQAIEQAQVSLEEGQAANHELSLWWALRLAVVPAAVMPGDLGAAERAVTMSMDIATRHNVNYMKILSRCLEGHLLVRQGDCARGLTLLRTALDECNRTGWTIFSSEFLAVLAESMLGLGQLAEGLATVHQAMANGEHGGERWYVAELLRIEGELLLEAGGEEAEAAAERRSIGALDVARQQGALFWELKAAMSLARLRISQGRPGDAIEVLSPVYDRFAEGFETADLKAADQLMAAFALGFSPLAH